MRVLLHRGQQAMVDVVRHMRILCGIYVRNAKIPRVAA